MNDVQICVAGDKLLIETHKDFRILDLSLCSYIVKSGYYKNGDYTYVIQLIDKNNTISYDSQRARDEAFTTITKALKSFYEEEQNIKKRTLKEIYD